MPSVIIRKKAIFEFGIGLCVLIGIGVSSFVSLSQLNNKVDWVRHTYIVKEDLVNLKLELRSAESNQRAYLLTGKTFYLSEFYSAVEGAYKTEAELLSLASDNPTQVKNLRELYVIIEKRLQVLRDVAELKEVGKETQVYEVVNSSKGKQLMDKVLAQIEKIRRLEDSYLETRLLEQEKVFQTTTSIVIFGGVISVVIVFGSLTIINNFRHHPDE